ncbi:MAG: tRNA (N6-threonylcarbamoyladenosine(37)-N6)-methyltransferase TrmO [Solirubrobacteraceae bacterium]
MDTIDFELRPIGHVESVLADPATAPKQGDEGAPDAWLIFDAGVLDGLRDISEGESLIVLTWLHLARRDVLRVHPRGDVAVPQRGVFSTRSPGRPNPIGVHTVRVLAVDGRRVRVSDLEAVNGTPIVDVKPCLKTEAGPAG